MTGRFYDFALVGGLLLLPGMSGVLAQENSGDYTEPKVISAPQPEYPKKSKEAGLEGTVSVRVKVSDDGSVVSADSPTGLGRHCSTSSFLPLEMLYQAVITAVKNAKFTPAMRGGKPVEAIIWVNSTFKLPPRTEPVDSTAEPDVSSKIDEGGRIVRTAKSLPRPDYPPAARALRASGAVSVKITYNEEGKVVLVRAIGGHPLLRSSAEDAACLARFSPVIVEGRPVSVTGVITYSFRP